MRDARSLIGASAASQLGDWLYNAALLGYVYERDRLGGWVGAATICRLLPYVLLGPIGGTVADRYDRRTVLLVGDLLRVRADARARRCGRGGDGAVVLVIALTALASAAGAAEKPAAMALLPVSSARRGSARPTPCCTPCRTSAWSRSGDRRASCSPWRRPRWRSSSTRLRSPSRRRSSRRCADAARRRATADDGAAAVQIRHGLRTARRTPFVIPLFIVVAMVEFTYGAQTVQLVLYAEQPLDLGAEGLRLVARRRRRRRAAERHRQRDGSRRARRVSAHRRRRPRRCSVRTSSCYAAVEVVVVAVVVTVVGGAGLVACEVVAETALRASCPPTSSAASWGCSTPCRWRRWSPAPCSRRCSISRTSLRRASSCSAPADLGRHARLPRRAARSRCAQRAARRGPGVARRGDRSLPITGVCPGSCSSNSPRRRRSARCRTASTSSSKARPRTPSTS